MVEFLPSKQDVAGSNPVSRSNSIYILRCFHSSQTNGGQCEKDSSHQHDSADCRWQLNDPFTEAIESLLDHIVHDS